MGAAVFTSNKIKGLIAYRLAGSRAVQVDWPKCFAGGCGQEDAPVAAVEDGCGERAARLFAVEPANNARFQPRYFSRIVRSHPAPGQLGQFFHSPPASAVCKNPLVLRGWSPA